MNLIPSFTVEMDIYDILYLSYVIPEERLRHAVPAVLSISTPLKNAGIISLVIFRSKNVTTSIARFLHFDYDQINLRTYVVDPVTGKNAVFFLRSGITSRFIAGVTHFLSIPWQPVSLRLNSAHDNTHRPTAYTVEGHWENPFHLELEKNQNAGVHVKPFHSFEEAVKFLTGPMVGLYGTPGGPLRFQVQHSHIEPVPGSLSVIDCPMLSQSGFVMHEELKNPQSLLVASKGHFSIHMPPQRLHL